MIRYAAVIAVVALVSATAHAEYTINVSQVGPNVVASGSGTIDLTGLVFLGSVPADNAMDPQVALLEVGFATLMDVYVPSSGPSSFGRGAESFSSSWTGDFAGINGARDYVEVPFGYVSGDPLSGTATWDNATFSSLGLTPGTYTYTWNSGPSDDSLVVNIGPAVPVAIPEPSSISLLGAAITCVGIAVCLRRRGAVPAAA